MIIGTINHLIHLGEIQFFFEEKCLNTAEEVICFYLDSEQRRVKKHIQRENFQLSYLTVIPNLTTSNIQKVEEVKHTHLA